MQKQRGLSEINLFVHPFCAVLSQGLGTVELRDGKTRPTRVANEFMKANFSKWGMRIKKIAKRRNSVLVIEPPPSGIEFIDESLQRFQRFAEGEFGKERIFIINNSANHTYSAALDFFLQQGFVPAKKIALYSFGEWRDDCVYSAGRELSGMIMARYGRPCELEVVRELSTPRERIPPTMMALRSSQRKQRKGFRRDKIQKKFY